MPNGEWQHFSHAFLARLKNYGVISKMTRKGNCLDNAPTERFFNG